MTKYRSIMSAYRDGYRITDITDCDDNGSIAILKNNNGDELILESSNAKLVKFFGERKLALIKTKFNN